MKKIKLKSYDFLMKKSYDRIKRGIFFDDNFKPYSIEFFQNILKYLEDCEMYEECNILQIIIKQRFDHDLNYKIINA
jgi:hypothetical protein